MHKRGPGKSLCGLHRAQRSSRMPCRHNEGRFAPVGQMSIFLIKETCCTWTFGWKWTGNQLATIDHNVGKSNLGFVPLVGSTTCPNSLGTPLSWRQHVWTRTVCGFVIRISHFHGCINPIASQTFLETTQHHHSRSIKGCLPWEQSASTERYSSWCVWNPCRPACAFSRTVHRNLMEMNGEEESVERRCRHLPVYFRNNCNANFPDFINQFVIGCYHTLARFVSENSRWSKNAAPFVWPDRNCSCAVSIMAASSGLIPM